MKVDAARIIRDDSSNPIRRQLREILLQEIGAQKFAPNQRFASERELAQRFGISRSSVRETIADLIHAGVLVRSSPRGTVLADAPTRPVPRQIAFLISEDIFCFVRTGYDRILRGVEDVCRRNGDVLLFQSIAHDAGRANLREYGKPSGYVIVGGVRRSILERLRQSETPLVLVDLLIHGEEDDLESVNIDYAGGTKLAVQHLYRHGHRQIGFIGFAGSEKYEAYCEALREQSLTYDPRHVEFLQPVDLEPGILAGFESMQRMIDRPGLPTAVLATNDCVARGAVEALAIAGIRVPKDISVVGYDDLRVSLPPRLTTVKVDLELVGRLAMEALIRRISGGSSIAKKTRVPVALIERASSGIAPGEKAKRSRRA